MMLEALQAPGGCLKNMNQQGSFRLKNVLKLQDVVSFTMALGCQLGPFAPMALQLEISDEISHPF